MYVDWVFHVYEPLPMLLLYCTLPPHFTWWGACNFDDLYRTKLSDMHTQLHFNWSWTFFFCRLLGRQYMELLEALQAKLYISDFAIRNETIPVYCMLVEHCNPLPMLLLPATTVLNSRLHFIMSQNKCGYRPLFPLGHLVCVSIHNLGGEAFRSHSQALLM